MLIAEQEDLTLLLLSSYVKDLLPLSITNKYTNQLLNSPKFWTIRFKQLHSDFILPSIAGFRRNLELYDLLLGKHDIDLLSYAEKYEHIEILGFLIKQKKSIFTTGANLLAKYGRLDLLQQMQYTYPDGRGLAIAMTNNHFATVKWVCEKIKIFPDPELIVNNDLFGTMKELFINNSPSEKEIVEYCTVACKYDKVDILDWCINYNVFPTVNMIDIAAQKGNLNVIKLAAKHKILPTSIGSELALINKHIDVVLWIKIQGINPENLSINHIINNRWHKELILLLNNEIGPSSNDYQAVVKTNNKEIIEVFLQYNYKPDYHAIDIAIINDNEEILNLFEHYDIKIDYHNVSQAVQVGNIKFLERFAKTDLLPTIKDANCLCANVLLPREKKMTTLEWLKSKKILPTSTGFILTLEDNNIALLSWLITNKIKPEREHIDLSIYGDTNVLQLFLQNGLIPAQTVLRRSFQDIRIPNLALLTQYKLL